MGMGGAGTSMGFGLRLSLIDDVSGPARGVNSSLAGIDANALRMAGSMMQVGNAMKGVGHKIFGFLQKGIKGDIEYGSSLKRLEIFAQMSRAEVEKFGREVTILTAKLPISEIEVLGMATTLAKMGIYEKAGAEGLKEISYQAVMMAKNTGMSYDNAASKLGSLANAFQLFEVDAKDADKAGEIIIQRMKGLAATIMEADFASIQTADDIMELMRRSAGGADALKLAAPSAAAFAVAVSNMGIKAEAGGTSINRFFNAIRMNSKKYAEFVEKTGLMSKKDFMRLASAEDGTQALMSFTQALAVAQKGAPAQFPALLKDLGLGNIRVADTTRALTNSMIRELAVSEDQLKAMVASGNVSQSQAKSFSKTSGRTSELVGHMMKLTEAFEAGSANEEVATRMSDDLGYSIQILTENINTISRQLAKTFRPVLAQLAQLSVIFTESLMKLQESNPELLQGAAILLLVAGAAFVVGGSILTAVAGVILLGSTLVTALTVAAYVVGGLGLAFLAVFAILAVFKSEGQSWGDFLFSIIDSIGNAITGLARGFMDVWEPFSEGIQEPLLMLKAAFQGLLASLGLFSTETDNTETDWVQVGQVIGSVLAVAVTWLTYLVTALVLAITTIVQVGKIIGSALLLPFRLLWGVVEGVIGLLAGLFDTLVVGLTGGPVAALKYFGTVFLKMFGRLGEAVAPFLDKTLGFFTGVDYTAGMKDAMAQLDNLQNEIAQDAGWESTLMKDAFKSKEQPANPPGVSPIVKAKPVVAPGTPTPNTTDAKAPVPKAPGPPPQDVKKATKGGSGMKALQMKSEISMKQSITVQSKLTMDGKVIDTRIEKGLSKAIKEMRDAVGASVNADIQVHSE